MNLPAGIDPDRFRRLLDIAHAEDLGEQGDLTTRLMGPRATASGRWRIAARQAGRLSGVALIEPILARFAPAVRVAPGALCDGVDVPADTTLARLSGPLDQMLAAERTMLNFLQRLSGVATLTQRFVRAVAESGAQILDTRKTVPGWRDLDKYAVRCGGGNNHRRGLCDAVLVKDNHLADLAPGRLAGGVFDMLNRLGELPCRPDFVEVEADSLEQVDALLRVVGVEIILLDNFPIAALREAVTMRDRAGLHGRVRLEASGNVTLANVAEVAATGVERIAVGALTHSTVALDIGLDAEG